MLLYITGEQLPSDFYSVPEVSYTTYNIGTQDLPDMYARALEPAALGLGTYIRQIPHAHVITITYMYIYIYIDIYIYTHT